MAVSSIVAQDKHAPRVANCGNDLEELVADLMADELGMQQFEAQTHAVAMLDDLEAYGAVWDSWAYHNGNNDAGLASEQPPFNSFVILPL